MIANDPFERTVSNWLHADAEHRIPDHLDAVLRRTRTERQRPAWSSLERWLPVDTTLSGRLAPTFRPIVPFAAIALLVITLLAAILVVGSRPRLPDPFGLAGNGAVVFAGNDGDIYIFDPATAKTTPLIAGKAVDRRPYYSRDGSQLVFARSSKTPGLYELTIAKSDGAIVGSLTRPINPGWIEWSPDGTRLAVIDSSPNTFSIVHLDGSETQNFDLGLEAEQIFWRPDGNELIMRTVSTGPDVETYGLFVVRADGTDPREIDISIPSQIQEPALSPDGTQVMFAIWEGDPIDGGHLYVVNVETGNLRRLVFDGPFESEYFGEWSPDGSRIVFTQGTAQETYQLAVGPAGGGHVVSLGPELPWDAGAQAAFSPDGSKVIARYNNGETWIFDASGGPGEQLDITTTELLNWQRVAP